MDLTSPISFVESLIFWKLIFDVVLQTRGLKILIALHLRNTNMLKEYLW